jgi:hypothetical protein
VGKHEAIVPKQRWTDANTRLIDEVGAEEWLRHLLAVLEGDYSATAGDQAADHGDGLLALLLGIRCGSLQRLLSRPPSDGVKQRLSQRTQT